MCRVLARKGYSHSRILYSAGCGSSADRVPGRYASVRTPGADSQYQRFLKPALLPIRSGPDWCTLQSDGAVRKSLLMLKGRLSLRMARAEQDMQC
jgi:hypothetical protein